MRSALMVALAIAACETSSSYPGGGGYGGGFGGGGYPGDGGYVGGGGCVQDSDCNPVGVDAGSDAGSGNGLVCARDGACVPASDVQTVHVKWTITGQPASATSCATVPTLEIDFSGSGPYGTGYGYAPVPCEEGEFTITKLETSYTYAQLGTEGDAQTGSGGAIPAGGGTVSLDLPY